MDEQKDNLAALPLAEESAGVAKMIAASSMRPAAPQSQVDLLARIESLEMQVRRMAGEHTRLASPLREVFLANVTGVQWQEKCVEGGAVVTFTDGRNCTSNTNAAALMSLATNQAVLLELRDTSEHRYLPIGGPFVYNEWLTNHYTEFPFGVLKRITATWEKELTYAVNGSGEPIPSLSLIDAGDWRTKNFIAILRVSDSLANIATGSEMGKIDPTDAGARLTPDDPLAHPIFGWQPSVQLGVVAGGGDFYLVNYWSEYLWSSGYGYLMNYCRYAIVIDASDGYKLKLLAAQVTPELGPITRRLHATILVIDDGVSIDAARYTDPATVTVP